MRLVGIELAPEELRVAHGERLFGAVRLSGVERIPASSAEARAAALAALARRRPQAVLTALPAALVTHRLLVVPFRDRRRALRVAPMEILGQLPIEPDDALVACEPLGPGPGGSVVLAVVVRRTDLEAHVAPLVAAGLPPVRVDLAPLPAWNLFPEGADDAALLVADGARSAVVVRRGGRVAGLRALATPAAVVDALAAEVRWTLTALGGAPPTLVTAGPEAGPALAAALGRVLEARVVSLGEAGRVLPEPTDALSACAVAAGLLAGLGRRARVGIALGGGTGQPVGSLRRIAVLGLVALAVGAVDLGLARRSLARRDAVLTRAIEAEARAVLPDATLVAPREQLAAAAAAAVRRRARLGGESSPLTLLRELSARVPATIRLDLDELTLERDGLVVHGRAESFDAVDALRRALATSPLLAQVAADETRTTVDGRGVEFRLRAARRPPGAPS